MGGAGCNPGWICIDVGLCLDGLCRGACVAGLGDITAVLVVLSIEETTRTGAFSIQEP